MADAPQPSTDTKESDKKMRERVDKLIAQAASESSGSITLGAKSLEYTVNAAFLPVVAGGLEGALGEPAADVGRVLLTRHKRWGSAVYLAGESYGTTRGAALADKLQSAGVALSGLILISCAMDLQSIVFAPANDLPYSLFLPAFANVSQYHGLLKGALGASSAAARAAAEAFVDEEYIAALQAGARLDGKRRSRVARRIAELTGLPQALVEEKNLRIGEMTYFFE